MIDEGDVLALLDEMQAIARTGLNFSTDPYARAHYTRLLELATTFYGRALNISPEAVRARLKGEIGCITPKVGADAAIFDEQGRILLVERADDRRWGLPAGWVEPNEPPSRTVVREAREEIGLEVEPVQIVDAIFRPASAEGGPHAVVSVVYLCEIRGGEIAPSHEVLSARYWRISDVPAWHRNHAQLATAAHTAWTKRVPTDEIAERRAKS
ncbi:MAG: NUDIX hydrolase N-terminal domain-containing protein [Gemmatimonadota bacterium]|nr:NUDIX hydrolase N-terminal domain-containing protein [Gemmatimonadota bacterium]